MNMNKYDRMVEMVSRTFALSIKNLPRTLREAVGLSYLLFRVSDCVEDHADMDAGRKVELLEIWEQVLQGDEVSAAFTDRIADLDGSDPEVYVAKQAGDLIDYLHTMSPELQGYIVDRCGRSALGMARWQKQGPLVDTVDELDDYMHQVAGIVGYLMTDIYTWYYPILFEKKESMMPVSRQIGLGLQTVNVIRGLRSDLARGWIFVPKEYLDQVGITRQQFFEPEHEVQAMQVVNMLLQKAERHLGYSLEYISAFPRRLHQVRLSNIWPIFFAVKTLALSRDNVEVVRSEVKITRDDVSRIMRMTTLKGWSNRWLRRYYEHLNHGNDELQETIEEQLL
jgi:farnesyl-diphosphate farnesyltransferase